MDYLDDACVLMFSDISDQLLKGQAVSLICEERRHHTITELNTICRNVRVHFYKHQSA